MLGSQNWIEIVNVAIIAAFVSLYVYLVVRAPRLDASSSTRGGLTWSSVIDRHARPMGSASLIAGFVMLAMVVFFGVRSLETLENGFGTAFLLHMLTELLAAAGLLIAGGALASGGKGVASVLVAAISLLIISTLFSLKYFGLSANSIVMDVVAVTLVLGLLVMAAMFFVRDMHPAPSH